MIAEAFDTKDAIQPLSLPTINTPTTSITTTHTGYLSWKPSPSWKISVYTDDGRIFYYFVDSPAKVREHSSAIIATGYRHNDGQVFEHYPPHRILKVKSENIPTNYPDYTEGT